MKTFEINPPITMVARIAPDLPGVPAPKQEFTVSSLTIKNIIDEPIKKRVSVSFLETISIVKIWDESDYDSLGDWTKQQLEDAVSEAINSNPLGVVTEALTFPDMIKFDKNSALNEKMQVESLQDKAERHRLIK